MKIGEEQLGVHALDVERKKQRIETLEALLATHEALGTESDSCDVRELKERLETARMQLAGMCSKGARSPLGGMRFSFETLSG
jgi:hypothetical protein